MHTEVTDIVRGIHENPHEGGAYGPLADRMIEHGEPGANVVVQAGRHATARDALHRWASDHPTPREGGGTRTGDRAILLPSIYHSRDFPDGVSVHTIKPDDYQLSQGSAHASGRTGMYPPVLVSKRVEVPGASEHHFTAAANPDNVEHLTADLPESASAHLRASVNRFHEANADPFHPRHFEQDETPLRLARGETIDRKGNTVGVNQWTGNDLKPDKNAPLKTEVVPENHWADGIVHPAVHPGTHNVAPTADAAWHERAAVHRALENLEPTRKFSQADVADHVQKIKQVMDSDVGKRLLSGPIENYTRGAKVLPDLVGKGDGVLRGSGVDSRPHSPINDRLTHLVAPLAQVAHRLIKLQNLREAGPTSEPLDFDPHAGPAYEVVKPGDENIPEDLPIDLPTPSSALRKIKVVSDEKADAVKAKATKESAKNTIAAAKANKDPGAIPVVKSAKPLGWKPPEENRYAAISRLLGSGSSIDQVKAHLTDANGHALSPRQAAASITNFLRAEKAKRHQEAAASGTVKLARPPFQADAIEPKHLKGPVATGPGFSVDPHIESTALAYHLRQIADDFGGNGTYAERYAQNKGFHDPAGERRVRDLAEASLAGKPMHGTNGDTFAALGEALKKAKHPLANAYDWKSVSNGLARDKWVEDQMNKILKADALDRYKGRKDLLWDHIHRTVASGSDRGNQILEHLKSQMGLGEKTYLFGKPSDRNHESLLDSIHRIADRHLDREYLKAVSADRKRGASHDPNDPLYWRKVMADSTAKKRKDGADKYRQHVGF